MVLKNFDYKKNLPKKFCKNQVSNSWDIPDMDKCHQNSFGPKKNFVFKKFEWNKILGQKIKAFKKLG